jgi:hypothetical protein
MEGAIEWFLLQQAGAIHKPSTIEGKSERASTFGCPSPKADSRRWISEMHVGTIDRISDKIRELKVAGT